MKEQLVVVGAGEFGEIAYEYFSDYSNYEVVGFAAEEKYISRHELFGLPVVPVEKVESFYHPQNNMAFVAITHTQLNRPRTRLCRQMKEKGYRLATFIHPSVFVGRNAQLGENCFIFEDNNIQRKAVIGNNVILWPKNHIGHRSIVKDNCYITSGVIISGYCEVGENSFLGVNCSLNDFVKVSKDTIIGNGAIVIDDITEPGGVYVGNPARRLQKSSYETFGVKEAEV
jgi:sugar O-acyltransferase (sialic acid O-acetyltransferase NeuD family)